MRWDLNPHSRLQAWEPPGALAGIKDASSERAEHIALVRVQGVSLGPFLEYSAAHKARGGPLSLQAVSLPLLYLPPSSYNCGPRSLGLKSRPYLTSLASPTSVILARGSRPYQIPVA